MMLTQKSQMGFVLGLFVLLLFGDSAFAKPQPPLQLTLLQTTLPNGTIEVSFEVVANISSESIDLSMAIDKSLSLVEGEPKWSGSMIVREKKTMKVRVQPITSASGKVIGAATIHLPEGGLFVQESAIVLNAKPKLEPLRSAPVRRKQGNKTTLEFKGK